MINKPIGPVVLITGPTASGKSALALKIAKEVNGEIVNIDSVQIYRYADIGSAKPSQQERAEVRSHLFDICDPNQVMNASIFAEMVSSKVSEILERDRVPILVGSSGLYVSAIFSGIPKLPKRDEKLRAELEAKESDELHLLLKQREPKIADRLHKNDRVRTIRALEISFSGEKSAQDLQAIKPEPYLFGAIFVITPERDVLYQRINQRAELMVKQGIVAEAKFIRDKFGADCGMLQSLGYAEALEDNQQENLADQIALNTRHYAKRQITFWMNEPSKRGWEIRPDSQDLQVSENAKTRPSRLFVWDLMRIKEEILSVMQQKKATNTVFFINSLD